METLLICAVGFLAFANGANDNFKGVATLWGAGVTSYGRAITWATAFTFLGSVIATSLGSGLAAKFSGAGLIGRAAVTNLPFLLAVSAGASATVLFAARLGLPVSTTHALTGALIGAGLASVGFSQLRLASLGKGIVLPLLSSPIVALVLTVALERLANRSGQNRGIPDCICADEPTTLELSAASAMSATIVPVPSLRWAPSEECRTGLEIARLNMLDILHWLSAAAISFARGLNDTPKLVAVFLILPGTVADPYFLVALAIAAGGIVGAKRVARTLSKEITPMAPREAVVANFVTAALVTLASPLGLPVSTTHVTSGGIFGIGLAHREKADWHRVRDIFLSWVATLPIGALLAVAIYESLIVVLRIASPA